MTVTGRAGPERKPRKGQLIDTADPAKAAAELVSALRQAGALLLRKDQTMSMNAWIVVGDQREVGNLVTVARSLGGPVGAVVAGPRSVADTVAGAAWTRWSGAARRTTRRPRPAPPRWRTPSPPTRPASCSPAAIPGSGCSSAPSPPGSRRPS